MSARADVVIEKSVDDVYSVGFAPRVRVVLRVYASSLPPETRVLVVDKIPLQARIDYLDPSFRLVESEGSRLLVADLTLGRGGERLLAYELEFLDSFDGFLEPAVVVVGSLSFSSQPARLKVKKRPAIVPPEVRSLVREVPGPVTEAPAPMLSCVRFEDIPFYSQAKEELKQALDSGCWVLIRGRPGLWKSRLVLAAACYLKEKKGYRILRAEDVEPGLHGRVSQQPIVVALPNLDYYLGPYPSLLPRLKELRAERGAVSAIVIASVSSDWDELEERLSRSWLFGPLVIEDIRQVFDIVIEVKPPSFDEVAGFLREELAGVLTEDALSLEWLAGMYEKGGTSSPGLTCEEIEALVKGVKEMSRREGRKLSQQDCSSVLSGILAQRRSSPQRRRGVG